MIATASASRHSLAESEDLRGGKLAPPSFDNTRAKAWEVEDYNIVVAAISAHDGPLRPRDSLA
jgi:hypothetical protein